MCEYYNNKKMRRSIDYINLDSVNGCVMKMCHV